MKKKKAKRSIPVKFSMAGLRRPRSDWSTSFLHNSANRGASTSGTHRRFNSLARGSPISDGNQTDDPGSDSDVNPRRQGNMSALIEARIQEAFAGSGFIKESAFQQAMDQHLHDQSQRMAALEHRQRASNAGDCPLMDCLFQSNKL